MAIALYRDRDFDEAGFIKKPRIKLNQFLFMKAHVYIV
jgi:hypothetical protein